MIPDQPTKLAWRPIAVLAGVPGLLILDNSLGGVATPAILQSLKSDINGVQGVFTLSAVVIAACLLTAGKLGDVIGRRRALLLGLSIRVLGSALAAAAPNLLLFGLGEAVIESIGGAIAATAAAALIADKFVGDQRARAFSIVGGASASAMALGPLVGGWVISAISWRAVFAFEAVAAFVLFLLSIFWVKNSQQIRSSARLDYLGAILSGVGLVLLVLGMQLAAHSGRWFPYRNALSWWGLSPVIFIIAAGVAVLGMFVWWQVYANRTGRPVLVDAALVQLAPLRATFLTGLAGQTAAVGMFFIYPVFLILVLGHSPQMVGLLLAPAAVTAFTASMVWPRLARRWSPRRVARLGAVSLVGAGLAAFVEVSPGIASIPIAVSAALLGCGIGLLGAQLPATAQGLVENRHRSETAGLFSAAQNLGAAMGFVFLGSVFVIALSSGVRQFVAAEQSLSEKTRAVAEVLVEQGVSFITADQAREQLIAHGVPLSDIDSAVEAYKKSQHHALATGSVLIMGLGVVTWLLARRMPSKVS